MGKMTRQLQRQARRRLGAVVDRVFAILTRIREAADEDGDNAAIAYCDEAFLAIQATLTPDGLPTSSTIRVLPDVVAGPIERAMARVRPEAPIPAALEHDALLDVSQ
jgi:hypothetical protein